MPVHLPVPHPVPVPVYKPIPIVKQIPLVKQVPVFQKVEPPPQQNYQKIPVFQKDFVDQQMENEIPFSNTEDSQHMNSEYQDEGPPQYDHHSEGGQQESKLN